MLELQDRIPQEDQRIMGGGQGWGGSDADAELLDQTLKAVQSHAAVRTGGLWVC